MLLLVLIVLGFMSYVAAQDQMETETKTIPRGVDAESAAAAPHSVHIWFCAS